MLKIKQSENGYWISKNWTYLDTYKATIYKRITFDEFEICIKFLNDLFDYRVFD